MLRINAFMSSFIQAKERCNIALYWLSNTLVQVGLVVIVWLGYVRHLVSSFVAELSFS